VLRPLLSWLANLYIKLVAGVPVRDTTSGYRSYRRAVLEETEFDRIKVKGYAVHGEMAYQAWIHGFRLGEVPIHFKNREREASKLTAEEIYSALLNFALLRVRYGFRPRRRRCADEAP
jgi:dolichol-phosphate mannosyltransferase